MKNILFLFSMLFYFLTGCVDNSQSTPPDGSSSGTATMKIDNIDSDHKEAPSTSSRSDDLIESQVIPEDGSDLWNKDDWTYMGPTAQIIGRIQEVEVDSDTLIRIKVKVDVQITEHQSIKKGDELEILFYDKLSEGGYVPQVGEQVMTQLNHYVTGAGREIEWGGEFQNFWYEKDGIIYYSNGELYKRDGFSNGLSFKQYAQSQGKS
ncbi:hypothetical protein ACF3MZ_17535 [Paenibacillaceae bacterium WGS1546]|uniref:hypothetical protein n=1 Tax=Cohnella sp. WGS1546 TaxID=3366810 RepID=UPI00372D41E0